MKADTYTGLGSAGAASGEALPFGAWGAHVAGETDAIPGENETLEQLQRRTEAHKQATKESEARTLRLAESARQVGADTLVALSVQGEQLGRVEEAQAKVAANLKSSEKFVRGMESWGGAFVTTVSGWFGKQDSARRPGSARGAAPAPAAEESTRATPGASSSGDWPPKTRSESQPQASDDGSSGEQDDSMGQIAGIVSDLRLQAEQMNSELTKQSGVIDRLNDSHDANLSKMKEVDKRTKALKR